MKMTAKGQVTIPRAIWEKAGLKPNSEVDFDVAGDTIRIFKRRRTGRGRKIVEAMTGRGNIPGHIPMTTDEIMAMTRGE